MTLGAELVEEILAADPRHPLRLAVDGVTASGKSTCARWLAEAVAAGGRPTAQVSMDGFHHVRSHRRRRGALSGQGYYADAYDMNALIEAVLLPLGPSGDRKIRTRVMDLEADEAVEDVPIEVAENAVVIVDGTFLHRPPLAAYWDFTVFVDTPSDLARERGIARDAHRLGGVDEAARAFDERYHEACRIYLREVEPAKRATVVLPGIDSVVPDPAENEDLTDKPV